MKKLNEPTGWEPLKKIQLYRNFIIYIWYDCDEDVYWYEIYNNIMKNNIYEDFGYVDEFEAGNSARRIIDQSNYYNIKY